MDTGAVMEVERADCQPTAKCSSQLQEAWRARGPESTPKGQCPQSQAAGRETVPGWADLPYSFKG